MDKLKNLSNETSVYKVQYTNPAVCLAEGKYILINHEQHTHLCYHITSPSTLGDVQHEFNLKTQDDYLITVKNPQHDSPPGTGLASSQKAKYPTRLQDMLGDYRFLPLITPEFLNFEGAELLLIGKGKTDLENTEIDVEKCLHQISDDVLTKHFKIIKDPLPITNVL